MSRWFRHYASLCRDEKLVSVAIKSKQSIERVVWVWCAILESAAEIDDDGRYDFDADEAAYFLRTDAADIADIIKVLEAAGRLAENRVVKWGNRQFLSDRSRERVAAYRERKRRGNADDNGTGTSRNDDVTLQKRHCNAPETETDTETDTSSLRSDVERVNAPSRKAKKTKPEKEPELSDDQIIARLSPWLAAETAKALVASRRNLRCKHTEFAVALLCRDLAKCRDPTAMAERAILSNWKTVYPERDHAAGNGSGQGSAAPFGPQSAGNGRGSGGIVAAAQRIIDRIEGEEHVSRQRDGYDRAVAGLRDGGGF